MIPAWLTGIGARAFAIGAAVVAAIGMVFTILAKAKQAGRDEQKAADLHERLEQETQGNEAANHARGDGAVELLKRGDF